MPHKRRTRNNLIAFSVVAAAMMGTAALVGPIEQKVDPVHSSFIQTHFAEAVAHAATNPGQDHLSMPDYVYQAGEVLNQQMQTAADLQTAREDGDRSAQLRTQEAENVTLLNAAEEIFLTDGGSIVGTMTRCNPVKDAENIFSCELQQVEFGGTNYDRTGLEACHRLRENFTATVIDGAVQEITSSGPGYKYEVKFEAEDFTQSHEASSQNYLNRGFSGFYGKLDDNNAMAGQALATFGRCSL